MRRCALALLLSLTPALGLAQTTQKLFHIERSKNKNEVHYDARLAEDGQIDPKEPVIVYWLAPDGHTWKPTAFDRANFYGVSVRKDQRGDFWHFAINAAKKWPMKLYVKDGKARIERTIDGQPAYLRKMYVKYKDGLIPGVQFIDLIGVDVRTGAERRQRVVP
jgi:hypothetical protein